jgi:hypothetical protein
MTELTSMFMSLLPNILAAADPRPFPVAFTLVYILGFIAAVSIGSVAWYNSKRPPGWEGSERPDIVPKVDTEEISES